MIHALLAFACGAAGLCLVTPWAAPVSVAALIVLGFVHSAEAQAHTDRLEIEKDFSKYEERILALEALKGTAAALLKVEARTSALERGVAAALRMDHD